MQIDGEKNEKKNQPVRGLLDVVVRVGEHVEEQVLLNSGEHALQIPAGIIIRQFF